MRAPLPIFGIFITIILDMAVGYIFFKRTVKGSCDGTFSLGVKRMCDCGTPRDILQKELNKEQHSDNQGIKVDH